MLPGSRASATAAQRSVAVTGPRKLAATTPSASTTSGRGDGVDPVAVVERPVGLVLDLLHDDGVAGERLGPLPHPLARVTRRRREDRHQPRCIGPIEVSPVDLRRAPSTRCAPARPAVGGAAPRRRGRRPRWPGRRRGEGAPSDEHAPDLPQAPTGSARLASFPTCATCSCCSAVSSSLDDQLVREVRDEALREAAGLIGRGVTAGKGVDREARPQADQRDHVAATARHHRGRRRRGQDHTSRARPSHPRVRPRHPPPLASPRPSVARASSIDVVGVSILPDESRRGTRALALEVGAEGVATPPIDGGQGRDRVRPFGEHEQPGDGAEAHRRRPRSARRRRQGARPRSGSSSSRYENGFTRCSSGPGGDRNASSTASLSSVATRIDTKSSPRM